ncbi:hypothetical protein [Pseudooceanicola sp. LIPI14-2-Ac024]|uniref:hypothetical protein n=1 Tax=Pseudooceanicola sp. LIPI14-2-Ac024 TaxID=3344875 RepID=UPI0035D01EBD
MLRQGLAVLALVALSACAGEGQRTGGASLAEVQRFAYSDPAKPSLTLYTIVNNTSGAGAHTALLINGSQRVIFDPAGSFHHEETPRRGDVLYGITPRMQLGYESMHARATYHVVANEVAVSPEVAEKALQLAIARGPVGQTQCATSTAAILKQLPGFEGIRTSFYPETVAESFVEITGAPRRTYYEDFTPPAGG